MDNYFNKRKELKAKAEKHTKEMEKKYRNEIEKCVNETLVYGGTDGKVVTGVCKREIRAIPNIVVDDMDTVQSLILHNFGKTAVLNFASYKNPGGMFIGGSSAQEESLCHESFLYNVLRRHQEYYNWNKEHKNRALYTNRALYLKDVLFFDKKGNAVPVDVITCAAPNYAAASKYASVDMGQNNAALYSRIKFVLNIAEENKVEALILGGFGCGVFGQDATVVAEYFKKILETYDYHFKNVYFSILNRQGKDNYEKFLKAFKQEKYMERLQYEVLNQTPKCKDYYFSNEGMYSFWGDYLIAHVGEKNILLKNLTGKKFDHPEIKLTSVEKSNVKQEIKDRFCGARNCNDANPYCPIVHNWHMCLQLL